MVGFVVKGEDLIINSECIIRLMVEMLTYQDLPQGRGKGSFINAQKQCPECPFRKEVKFPEETNELGLVLEEKLTSICLLGMNWKRLKQPRGFTQTLDCKKLATSSLEINELCQKELKAFENPTVGMAATNLTEGVLKDVIEIYRTWVGGDVRYYQSNRNEFRFGSWASDNSKLMIYPFYRNTNPKAKDVYYFDYYDNGAMNKKFAKRLEIQFNYQVDRFLRKKSIAIDLDWEVKP